MRSGGAAFGNAAREGKRNIPSDCDRRSEGPPEPLSAQAHLTRIITCQGDGRLEGIPIVLGSTKHSGCRDGNLTVVCGEIRKDVTTHAMPADARSYTGAPRSLGQAVTPVLSALYFKEQSLLAAFLAMKVTIKEWNAVASWRWDMPEDEVCGICRVQFDGTCPTCKFPGDDCSLRMSLPTLLYKPGPVAANGRGYLFSAGKMWPFISYGVVERTR
jgi:hypothetical protein